MTQTLQDVRYAFRMLAKNPMFTGIAVLTLALGIGANTAIFSVLDSVLLRSLPVAHPERLAALTNPDDHGSHFGNQTGERSLLAYSEFEYLRDHNEVFSGVLAADSELPDVEVRVGGASGRSKEIARIKLVSGDYFEVLGVAPAAGRFFTSETDRVRDAAPVAVISHAYWKQRFGLDPGVLGKTIRVRETSFEIMGVAPPGFFGETVGETPDVWVPMVMQSTIYPGRDYLSPAVGVTSEYMWLQTIARLKPDVTLAQAGASINVVFKRCITEAAGVSAAADNVGNFLDQRIHLRAGAGGASTLHEKFGEPLKVLMALVGLVMLIACANVANLLLARGAARRKEFAMRLAIGAGRPRLIRQLLTESLLLASLGAGAGLVLGRWGVAALVHMVGESNGVQLDLQLDGRILAFTTAMTVLTAILFGLIPALRSTRVDLTPVLKSTAGSGGDESVYRRLPLGKIMVAAQVAVSLVMLVAAGLFVRSLTMLNRVNLGYNRENLLLFRVNNAAGGYKGAAITQLHQEVLARISAIPGLRGVALSHDGLFSHAESGDPIAVEGYTPKPNEEMDARMDHVGPGYFSNVGIPILLGREIGTQDSGSGMRAAVINQTFARRYFPNINPLGKHVRDTYPDNPHDMEIVGVVADAKYNSLREETPPRLYAPFFNPLWDQGSAVYEVRTMADAASVSAALRQVVRETAPALPPVEIHTMSALVDTSLDSDRFVEQLAGVFGALATLLASIGLYGIMMYEVTRRTREIGIRMALGARGANVLGQVLRETGALVLIGIGAGVPLAIGGTYLVRSMLFGVGLADPVVLALAAVLLGGIAVVAGFVPALRATRVDPLVALRYE
jgi:predicted permease